MSPRALLAALQRWYAAHSARDRRILVAVAAAVVLSLAYVAVVEPLRRYRRRVAEEVAEGFEQLERAARFRGAGDTLRAERDELKQRLEQAKQRLLPGGSGALGAAALQERANALAADKGITVQSTQVMREEAVDPFRKVTVRLTMSGELRPFSDFMSGLEYGPQQLAIPFLELSRRGAVAGAKGPRTLSATVEVSGYLLGAEQAKNAEVEPAEGEGEGAPGAGEAAPGAGEAPAPPPQAAGGEPTPAKPPEPESPPAPPATAGQPPAPPATAGQPAAPAPPPEKPPAPAPPAEKPPAPAPTADPPPAPPHPT